MMQGKLSSTDRVARAAAMLVMARRMNTPKARAEADIALMGLSRDELRQALARAGEVPCPGAWRKILDPARAARRKGAPPYVG